MVITLGEKKHVTSEYYNKSLCFIIIHTFTQIFGKLDFDLSKVPLTL